MFYSLCYVAHHGATMEELKHRLEDHTGRMEAAIAHEPATARRELCLLWSRRLQLYELRD